MGKIWISEQTLPETWFVWFGKKNCPKCLSKLKKENRDTFVKNGKSEGFSTTIKGEIYKREIIYICKQCSKEYSIQELMEK